MMVCEQVLRGAVFIEVGARSATPAIRSDGLSTSASQVYSLGFGGS